MFPWLSDPRVPGDPEEGEKPPEGVPVVGLRGRSTDDEVLPDGAKLFVPGVLGGVVPAGDPGIVVCPGFVELGFVLVPPRTGPLDGFLGVVV